MPPKPEKNMPPLQDVTIRFGDLQLPDTIAAQAEALHAFLSHRSCRAFTDRPVEPALVDLLCAAALSSPTKSDLQQRDLVVLDDPVQRKRITDLLTEYPWAATAPIFLVFCGNNRR